ncbi:MAG: hypothetical protein WCG27_08415 [Pseudomonadota bacterium]
MRVRVGLTCSYTNIARDFGVDLKTVMNWPERSLLIMRQKYARPLIAQ